VYLPPGNWDHVLAAGRQLPLLQGLSIKGCIRPYVINAADVAGLHICCTNLRQLQMGQLCLEGEQHPTLLLPLDT
jgi:hypothetical protein